MKKNFKKLISTLLGAAILITAGGAMTSWGDSELESGISMKDLMYNEENISLDVEIQNVDGIIMVPASIVLKEMGYEVVWKEDDKSVEISKGPHFTSIKVGENKYFKNKMAAKSLSHEPVIIDGRVLVPAEFFSEILNIGIRIHENNIILTDAAAVIRSGFVSEIKKDSNGQISQINISNDLKNTDINSITVINVSSEFTIFNKEIKEGDQINAICSLITTMSIPAQTPGYIIY